MINFNRRSSEVSNRKFFADSKRNVFHDRAVLVPQFGESRINVVVEDVALEKGHDFLSRMYSDWFRQLAKQIINKDRQARDVIHVRVRNDYVAHGTSLRVAQRQTNTACVHCYLVVD